MHSSRLILLVSSLFILAGCYEMKQDDRGRTIKVNKLTGDISVIDGDRIVKLKNEKEIKAEQDLVRKLADAKNWSSISLPIANSTSARLVTKWNNDVLYYQFYVDKNLRMKGNYLARLTIQLYDNASFLVQEIPISLSSMTGSVGLDGKTIQSMEHKGQVPMSDDTYKKISDWSVTWYGFNN